MLRSVRAVVTRLEPAPPDGDTNGDTETDTGGDYGYGDTWLLNFAGVREDPCAFGTALTAVKALPTPLRRWVPEERAWRVRRLGLAVLAARWPRLRDALARAEAQGMGEAAAFARLCLTPAAPPALVRSAYHLLALAHHPDVGDGDAGAMGALDRAFEIALPAATRRHGPAGRNSIT